ncbi:MAG: hypothetical protein LKF01_00255 [Lactobacillus sp.]|jgi:hypothetical protein|nr:hypothetical protein [Lactobacillus sp.]MCH4067975.1 hypothetical protein [Lactobacillus sp.]MCI1304069.1 hypothetical protein [Lactobacillus sp.]MCI1329905.1 hypothetical protein [Lactobacillus sp.]MCI1399505.1 hypothetical protein [Lactobacillus sp.]
MKIIDNSTPNLRKFKPGTILKVSDGTEDDADYLLVAYTQASDQVLQLINLKDGTTIDGQAVVDPSDSIDDFFEEDMEVTVYHTMKLVSDDEE